MRKQGILSPGDKPLPEILTDVDIMMAMNITLLIFHQSPDDNE